MRIVDASVALKWFVEEAGADAAALVLNEDLVAPAILLGEVGNGLWKKRRLGEVTHEQVIVAVANLRGMLAEVYGIETLFERATQIAVEVDHPVYDCFYIALAERLRLPVVTADLRMIAKLSATSYAQWLEPLA